MPTQAADVDTDDIGESGVEQQQQQQCMFVPWKDAMNCLTAVFSVWSLMSTRRDRDPSSRHRMSAFFQSISSNIAR